MVLKSAVQKNIKKNPFQKWHDLHKFLQKDSITKCPESSSMHIHPVKKKDITIKAKKYILKNNNTTKQ
jgi:hypothetical protein